MQLRGRLAPSSPGKQPNRVLLVSLAELKGKTQTQARSPSLPGSLLHIPTPRHVPCLAFHATRSNSYLLSTHCLHCIVASGTEMASCRKNRKDRHGDRGSIPDRGWLPATGCYGEEPPPSPHSGDSPGEDMAPRGAAGPGSPSPPETWLEGKGKESESLDHPRAPLRLGARPRLRPPGEPRARAPNPDEGRNGLSLPPASLRCDHGRPLTPQRDSHGGRITRVSDPASRLHRTPAPQLPNAKGAMPGRLPGPFPPPSPSPSSGKAVTWLAGEARTRPRGGKGDGRRWPPAGGDLGNLED